MGFGSSRCILYYSGLDAIIGRWALSTTYWAWPTESAVFTNITSVAVYSAQRSCQIPVVSRGTGWSILVAVDSLEAATGRHRAVFVLEFG